MATQSPENKPENPDEAQQVAAEPPTKTSTPSVFVNSEPIREDQIQNAVKFLSHPKVRGSPVIYRRSFLEKKGLTKEEIDESFRRVPDPPPSAQATGANQDGQGKTSHVQAQSTTQSLQPAAAASKPIAPVGTLAWYRFHWSHAILGVGLLAASGCGTALLIKNVIIPRMRSWVRRVVMEDEDNLEKKTDTKPSLAEEAAAAAKAAAAAAADVAKASQEMLNSKTEERRYFGELMSLLDVQVQEMKSMSNSIRKLEGERGSRTSLVEQEDNRVTVTKSKQQYVNGKAAYDMQSVQSFAAPASVEPSVAPHSKSYMDIMAMVQRGEKPPNVRDIDDLPPNPNQQLSNPRLAPRAKPWEIGQTQTNSSQLYQSQPSTEAFNSSRQENGINYQLDGDSPVPWWQRKTPSITEIENEDEVKAASYEPVRQRAQRAWVPPQPPPVAMPEAAEAIRRPKPSVQKETLVNDQPVERASDVTEELQRVTKISESGGALEMYNGSDAEVNNGNSYLKSAEIQEEENYA